MRRWKLKTSEKYSQKERVVMPIRRMEAKDNQAVANLVRTCLAAADLKQPGTAYYDPQLDDLYHYYTANTKRGYWVLVDDLDQVLAGCGFAEYQGDTAELQKLYVNPDARGHGAAHQLMAQVEAGAKAAGYTQLYLETHRNLKSAIQLYTNAHWTPLAGPMHVGPHTTMDHFFIKAL